MNEKQMITLLIADDEATIRNGLSTVVPWEEFGIRCSVGLAAFRGR